MNSILALLKTSKFVTLSTLRNGSTIFFGFAFPLIFTVMFSFLGGGGGSYDIGVLSNSSKDNPVYRALESSDVVNLLEDMSDEEIREDLERGRLSTAIDIQLIVTDDGDGRVEYLVNVLSSAADPQDAAIVLNIIERITDVVNDAANPEAISVVNIDNETIEGRKYNQIDFILPGQLAFALLSTAVFGTAFSFLVLRKTGVLKRLSATSSPRWIIIGSKIIASMLVAALQAIVIIAVGWLFFNFTLVHGLQTFVEMVVLSIFGLLVFMGFGLVVASLANSEETASPIANIFTLPQFILSGAFFPIDALPEWLQFISRLLPMTYLNDALRQISFEGGSFIGVWPEIGVLLIWAVILYIPAVRLFRWE